MGRFTTIEGTKEDIDRQLNNLAEKNHVKIVSSNSFTIVYTDPNTNYSQYNVLHTAHLYLKERTLKKAS